MADKRSVRRDATQAAHRLLQGTLLAAAADLGEVHAELTQARDGIETAVARGQDLVRHAQEAADKLVAAARQGALEVEQDYAARWRAAQDTGWSPAQLREMGYPTPPSRRRSNSLKPAAEEGTPGNPQPVPESALSTEHPLAQDWSAGPIAGAGVVGESLSPEPGADDLSGHDPGVQATMVDH